MRTNAVAARQNVRAFLDSAADCAEVKSNCMFQLSIMLARVALESMDETYQQLAAQRLMAVLRDKPTSNVVSLFPQPARIEEPLSA